MTILLTVQLQDIRNTLRQQKLTVEIGYASTRDEDHQLYGRVNEAISRAEKSIRVIGMYRPFELPHKQGRKSYYDLLKEIIELKIQQNQPFIYERVVQVETVTNGRLNVMQTDPLTISHCRDILAWKKQKSAVSVHVKQTPRILGALSILIVDEKEFFMVVPDIVRNDQGVLVLEGLQLSLNFTDPEGALTEPMKTFLQSSLTRRIQLSPLKTKKPTKRQYL